jgi:hypothetical protein
MGVFNLATKVIAWSGTLLYAIVNEALRSLRSAILSLAVFFLAATIIQFYIAIRSKDYVYDSTVPIPIGQLVQRAEASGDDRVDERV